MLPKLSEFEEIIDGDWKGGTIAGKRPTEEDLTRCLQALLTRQCIYSSSPGLGRTYEIIRAYASFFEAYFGCLGYRLVVSPRDQMVALSVPVGMSRYDSAYQRMQKDQTQVLLALRLMWEEGVSSQEVGEGGIVETTTGDLIDRIKSVTQTDPPSESNLLDILRYFQKYGVVRVGERDRVERVSPLSILPGVNIVAPDSFLEDLKGWASSTARQEMRSQNEKSTEQPEKTSFTSANQDDDLKDVDLSELFTIDR